MRLTVAQVIQEARALVEQGWCQVDYRRKEPDGNTRYCLVGAFHQVQRQYCGWSSACFFEHQEAIRDARQALFKHIPVGYDGPEHFNDDPRTSRRRVLAVFDRALVEVAK